jgi:DNA invertase Pin-like site-specific DNA recombinase
MSCYYQFGSKVTGREKYWKPKRNMATKEIRRLVIEGVPYAEIWQQLGISERSFYRYLDRAYKQDREVIAHKITNEDVFHLAMIPSISFFSAFLKCSTMVDLSALR